MSTRTTPEPTGDISIDSVTRDDLPELFVWINDPILVRLSTTYRPVSYQDHENWFHSIISERDREVFSIRFSGKLIGVAQLFDIHLVHRSAEISIRIGNEAYRGRGVGKTVLDLVCDHARRDLNIHRITMRAFANNEAAIRCYEKAGFEREGILREAYFIDGHFVDCIVMGKLLDR